VAGSPARGFVKEGALETAGLNAPVHLAYRAGSETLYISDPAEDVILELARPGCPTGHHVVDAGPRPDAGPPDLTPAPDAGLLPCSKLYQCALGCGDDAVCVKKCEAQGTAKAQKLLQALFACAQKAIAGTCSKDCPPGNTGTQACGTCIALACLLEGTACLLDV
jgi:hypothetical protein